MKWLWIPGLGERNEWMELIDVSFLRVSTIDATVVMPDGLRSFALGRLARGDAADVIVFLEPQTEIHCTSAVITWMSTDDSDNVRLSLQYAKTYRVYSGAP